MPVKPTELCRGEVRQRRTFARQGRLSRHKVSVGEPADGSPPIFCIVINQHLLHTHLVTEKLKNKDGLNISIGPVVQWLKIPPLHGGDPCSIHGGSIGIFFCNNLT